MGVTFLHAVLLLAWPIILRTHTAPPKALQVSHSLSVIRIWRGFMASPVGLMVLRPGFTSCFHPAGSPPS